MVICVDTVERIFDLLKQQGIEQKTFAVMLGTTDKTVSAWRCGRSKSYTKFLPQIADALNTSTEYLLVGTETKKMPATETDDGQAQKLAKALLEIGIDVNKLSDAEISRVARIAAAALQD